MLLLLPQRYVFSSKSQLDRLIFEQTDSLLLLPQRYVFSSKSQLEQTDSFEPVVVVATTKVRIFKQITTDDSFTYKAASLLLLPQRYVFSSKSQQNVKRGQEEMRCCCYHKGTYFQANHNKMQAKTASLSVVVATTKVRIFKQITTAMDRNRLHMSLLLLPQRYVFSSKSQRVVGIIINASSCCCYHKGTYFQANHNS